MANIQLKIFIFLSQMMAFWAFPPYNFHSGGMYSHQPSAHLRKYQLGPYYMGIKLFNTLPSSLKIESHNPSRFRTLLKKFLLESSLYSLEEFYNICKSKNS